MQIYKIKTMIYSLTIKNYLSFKDEVTFSFEATNDKKLEDYHMVEVTPGGQIIEIRGDL